jgi:hypothetical protein
MTVHGSISSPGWPGKPENSKTPNAFNNSGTEPI